MNELEIVKKVVHNYLITTMSFSTLSMDLKNIEKVVKIPAPYEQLLNNALNILDKDIKMLRQEMTALKIHSNMPSSDLDEYFVEYTIVAKGEEHKVTYARAALRNQVSNKISDILNSK